MEKENYTIKSHFPFLLHEEGSPKAVQAAINETGKTMSPNSSLNV